MSGDVEWGTTHEGGIYPRHEIVAKIGDFHITIYASEVLENRSRIIIETDDRIWFAAGQSGRVHHDILKSRAVDLVMIFEAIRGDMS